MTKVDRRTFLRGSAVVGSTLFGMQALIARNAVAAPGSGNGAAKARKGEGGYGELIPTPANNTGQTFLALPRGFEYTILGVAGSIMSDGNPTPNAHDGMAAFALPNGNIRLIRNHENRDNAFTATVKGDLDKAYDKKAGGGTTSLEVRPNGQRELVRDFVSLNGTTVNCAGGPTPWGSWLSCEETTVGETQGYERDHGYIFEVPALVEDEVTPVPLKAMGRFVHEAIAIDPDTGIVYETEDRSTAGFYRFIPNQPGNLSAGGRLQMLAIKDRPNYNTITGQRVGRPLPVTWVDIDVADPEAAELDSLAVFKQGAAKGGALFSRLEGCWYGDRSIFFHATDGGDMKLGQVWQYIPRGRSGGQLVLLFESPDEDVLDAPDNITVSPRGGLVLCEDGGGEQYLRGLTQRGRIFDFALNLQDDSEFAGACFSPDGETLFVNTIGETRTGPDRTKLGTTYAIWGPWREGAL